MYGVEIVCNELFNCDIVSGSVLTTYGSRDSDRSEPVENQPQFLSIMAAYGQSFLLSDISIFQQNLEALQNLHTKWKLYHKVSLC